MKTKQQAKKQKNKCQTISQTNSKYNEHMFDC